MVMVVPPTTILLPQMVMVLPPEAVLSSHTPNLNIRVDKLMLTHSSQRQFLSSHTKVDAHTFLPLRGSPVLPHPQSQYDAQTDANTFLPPRGSLVLPHPQS